MNKAFNVPLNGIFYPAKWYNPETDGCIGHCGYDSETSLIRNKTDFPDFIVGMAFNGKTVYYIEKQHLKQFFDLHKKKTIFMANQSFDLGVAQKVNAIDDSLKETLLKKHVSDVFILESVLTNSQNGGYASPTLDSLALKYKGLNVEKGVKYYLPSDTYLFNSDLSHEKYVVAPNIVNYIQFVNDVKDVLHVTYKELTWDHLDGDNFFIEDFLKYFNTYFETDFKMSKFKVNTKREMASSGLLKGATNHIRLIKTLVDVVNNYQNHPYCLVRLSFSNFLNNDGSINYKDMPFEYLCYAGIDAISTFEIGQILTDKIYDTCQRFGVDPEQQLSAYLMSPKSIVLDRIARKGLFIDKEHMGFVKKYLQDIVDDDLEVLKKAGWEPGPKSNAKLEAILGDLVNIEGINIERTATGKISLSSDALEKFKHIEVIARYLSYRENKKLLDFTKLKGDSAHTRFNTLVGTGRTSSYGPNIQNLPRDPKIRPMFIARPKKCLVSIDYRAVELATLAQVCYRLFGFSKMRELINQGIDLHTYLASKILNIPMDKVTKNDRQKAKAVNFGYPGGLTEKSFIQYAFLTYNVLFTEEEAKAIKQIWLETFPEMELYLKNQDASNLLASGLMESYLEEVNPKMKVDFVPYIFKGIISGNISTKKGREYTDEEIEWAFNIVSKLDFINKEDKVEKGKVKKGLIHNVNRRSGGPNLWKAVIRSFNFVTFNSGRVRNWCTYTQSKNTPFQGLAADGATSALIRASLAGYDMVNFIHDEIIFEVPISENLREVEAKLSKIMIDGMKVHVPDVDIHVEAEYMLSWNKAGTHFLDKDGKLVPMKAIAKSIAGDDKADDLMKELFKKWDGEKQSYKDLIKVLKKEYQLDILLSKENELSKEYEKNLRNGHDLEFFNSLSKLEVAKVA